MKTTVALRLCSLPSLYLAMVFVVVLSNILVQYPINDWLTWGAFPYPLSFFFNELTNRIYGPLQAKRVVYVGFIFASVLSFQLATPKIAIASISAFLVSQLLDISIFNRLRSAVWWCGPLAASLLASLVDTCIFWSIAFWGEGMPLIQLALGDFTVKSLLDLSFLIPFRWIIFQRLFTQKS